MALELLVVTIVIGRAVTFLSGLVAGALLALLLQRFAQARYAAARAGGDEL